MCYWCVSVQDEAPVDSNTVSSTEDQTSGDTLEPEHDTGDQTSSFPSGLNHIPLFSSTGNQTQLVRKSSCFSFEWRLNEFNHLQCWTHPVCSFGNQISFIFWKPNESTTIESRIGPHYTTWKPNDFSQTWTRKHHQTSSLITVFCTFTSSGNPTELITYSPALLTVSPTSGPEQLPLSSNGNKTSSLPISIHLMKNWASSLKSGPEYIVLNVRETKSVSSPRV